MCVCMCLCVRVCARVYVTAYADTSTTVHTYMFAPISKLCAHHLTSGYVCVYRTQDSTKFQVSFPDTITVKYDLLNSPKLLIFPCKELFKYFPCILIMWILCVLILWVPCVLILWAPCGLVLWVPCSLVLWVPCVPVLWVTCVPVLWVPCTNSARSLLPE